MHWNRRRQEMVDILFFTILSIIIPKIILISSIFYDKRMGAEVEADKLGD